MFEVAMSCLSSGFAMMGAAELVFGGVRVAGAMVTDPIVPG